MPRQDDKPIYDALALPNEALQNGGVEVLRAGIIDDELYVSARRAFKNPAEWGELLAAIARRIALAYSLEDSPNAAEEAEKEALADIEEAFAAELGAPVIVNGSQRQPAERKARAKKVRARKPVRKTTKRSKH
jgi:Domain of unknown function (DUF5076)